MFFGMDMDKNVLQPKRTGMNCLISMAQEIDMYSSPSHGKNPYAHAAKTVWKEYPKGKMWSGSK